MKQTKLEIINGCLRTVENTNLVYVEPHRVIIKDITKTKKKWGFKQIII